MPEQIQIYVAKNGNKTQMQILIYIRLQVLIKDCVDLWSNGFRRCSEPKLSCFCSLGSNHRRRTF
jgi:hypothetical protein